MAWYSGILNAGAANSSGYINPGASLGGLQATGTAPLSNMYPGSIVAVQNASTLAHDHRVHTLKQYCMLIGWEFIHLYIPDIESNDPKVAILKLAKEGEVIKDVGVRIGDHNFYIMREPRQSE